MTPGPDDGTPDPIDPITALREGAAAVHEAYLEYVKVGFTEAQALELVKAMIAASMGGKA